MTRAPLPIEIFLQTEKSQKKYHFSFILDIIKAKNIQQKLYLRYQKQIILC